MRIVNGRFLGDSLGYFTFFNNNGKSTVDYVLASQELFYMINSFQVKPPSDLSDHCLITANLYCHKQQPQVEEQELWSPPGSFKWSDQNKDTFIDCLLNQNSTDSILSLNELWDDISFNDIDFLVGKTNEI